MYRRNGHINSRILGVGANIRIGCGKHSHAGPSKRLSFSQSNGCVAKDQSNFFISLAGLPPTMVLVGTSLVTMAPAATKLLGPTETPGPIKARAQIHDPSRMVIGLTIKSKVGLEKS